MSVLLWIVVSSLGGGVLSVCAAALAGWQARPHWIPVLISYAIGALLGAAFLDVLPHALESHADPAQATATILGGILLFFLLEKLVLWRHCHEEQCEGHEHAAPHHDNRRSGILITVGDTFHNFVDGILIAASFMQSIPLGVVTALAIIAHEIPQEIGDFLILLHSGYSRMRALALNVLSSFATLVGGVLAYYALDHARGMIPVLLAMAAASMIYVAVADLIPGLHKRPELHATVEQVLFIGLGIGSIYGVQRVVEGFGL
ncbi:MAG: ZIP family metal transporter [Rhodocyclaceae bacterium]|nr:ZIP family metal transporter [Rhodocyclaceae bacterium]